MKTGRFMRAAAVVMSGVLLLSGCGSKTQKDESAGTAPAGTEAAAPETSQTESEPEQEVKLPPESETEQDPVPETTAKPAETTASSQSRDVVTPQMMGVTEKPSATGNAGAPESEAPVTDVQPSAPDTQSQPQGPVDTSSYTAVTETVYASENVNVRTGPGTEYNKIGALSAGQAVTRTGIGDGWSRIIFENTEAYAASQYLTTEQPQTEAPAPQTAEFEFWSGDLAAIQALSNREFTGAADERDRDAKNVPNGSYYLTKLYHKYHADFIQDTNQNIIYLTMDEGYEAGYTPTILQTLRDKNVKAVFFVTKQFYDSHPELIQEMINDGHIIGNHTCAHPSDGMPAHDLEWQGNDIMTLHNLIKGTFGYDMKLFRYPSGLTSEQSMAYVASLGYTSVFWSFAYVDYDTSNQMDPAVALEECISCLHPGAIYLLHAVSSTNTAILGQFIDEARARGFEFGIYPVN